MSSKTQKLAVDKGTVCLRTKSITFQAVPFPLPQAWQDRLKQQAKNYPGDFAGLEAIEIEMRGSIGFEYTRPFIPPRIDPPTKAGAKKDNVKPTGQELWG
jgi:hypothetical protein